MTINEIIKLSLERLRNQHLSLTPDNYSKIFCEIAKEKNVVVEDCEKVQNSIKKLDASLQEEVKKFKVHDIDALLSYYNALIKRSNVSEHQKIIRSYLMLSKRLLQAITMLHNKEASDLADISIRNIESSQSPSTIEVVRDKWLEFISSYDDSFMEDLKSLGIKGDDFRSVIESFKKHLKSDNADFNETFASLITASLVPSIASSVNDELASISYELKKDPKLLNLTQTHEKIKSFIKKRIELDKKEVSEKIQSLSGILNDISKKIMDLVGTSEAHAKEVNSIKVDLKAIDIQKESFESIQAKLLKIADSLEIETNSLTEHILNDKKTIDDLKLKVQKLESALIEAKKESKEDFLTHVASKRALTSELDRVEEAFNRYETNFCLCFFDIDHFKMVNDTYGHEAGDVILATIGKILNKYVRKVDFVGRYGGEEFLVILPSISIEHGINFANKIIKIIDNFKFIYRKERINITVSGGLSERAKCKSLDDTLRSADKNLYLAKDGGRNQVYPKLQ